MESTSPEQQPQPEPAQPAEGTKECPRCAETIKAAATVCRFCGADLAPSDHPPCRICAKKGRTVQLVMAPEKTRQVAATLVNVLGSITAILIFLFADWKLGLGLFVVVEIIYYAIPKVDHPTRQILQCPQCKARRKLR